MTINQHPEYTTMSAITDLDTLLASMHPVARKELFVFCTIPGHAYGSFAALAPIASFQETEGLTLILERQAADNAGLKYDGLFSMITLSVHSSLAAVGLTACVATELAQSGISANVVAAYFHDHVFVPAARADEALTVLSELAQRHASQTQQSQADR